MLAIPLDLESLTAPHISARTKTSHTSAGTVEAFYLCTVGSSVLHVRVVQLGCIKEVYLTLIIINTPAVVMVCKV